MGYGTVTMRLYAGNCLLLECIVGSRPLEIFFVTEGTLSKLANRGGPRGSFPDLFHISTSLSFHHFYTLSTNLIAFSRRPLCLMRHHYDGFDEAFHWSSSWPLSDTELMYEKAFQIIRYIDILKDYSRKYDTSSMEKNSAWYQIS